METALFITIFTSALAAMGATVAAANAKKTNELHRIRMARRAAKRRIRDAQNARALVEG